MVLSARDEFQVSGCALAVDAVLEDPQARAEVIARLRAELGIAAH